MTTNKFGQSKKKVGTKFVFDLIPLTTPKSFKVCWLSVLLLFRLAVTQAFSKLVRLQHKHSRPDAVVTGSAEIGTVNQG